MGSVGREEVPTAATTPAPAAADPSQALAPAVAGAPSSARVGPGPRDADGPETAEASLTLSAETMAQMRAYRNLRYHEDRQSHYERLLRWSNFVTVVLGSTGLMSLLLKSPFWVGAAALLTTLVGAGQLVFDFAKRAREEADLKKECAQLLASTDEPGFASRKLEAALANMYGTELETYHAVNALAYNATQLAFGRPKDTLLKVTSSQKWLRHFRTYEPSDFDDVVAA